MGRRTPLYPVHEKLGARLIDFGGWDMPVQYSSIVEEHNAVRRAAGLFDISHMGEFFVSGPGALDFLNAALTNDVRNLEPGRGQYTLICNERGGVIDDLYLYCIGLGNYLLIVNASRIEADFAWFNDAREKFARSSAVFLDNQSDSYGAVALQGPSAAAFIDEAIPAESALSTISKNEVRMLSFEGELIYAARTGYTGEDGFELISPAPLIEKVWSSCMKAGERHGVKPCGLGARDTLRLEACYPLYGHELDENSSPIEAGLGFFVALDKGEFTGRAVLAEHKQAVTRKLAAFKMTGKAPPPRADYAVYFNGDRVGQVTSGTQSPTLGIGLGLAYVPAEIAKPETPVEIEIRNNRFPAQIVKKPFYKRSQGQ